jgi:hypothetical protein
MSLVTFVIYAIWFGVALNLADLAQRDDVSATITPSTAASLPWKISG